MVYFFLAMAIMSMITYMTYASDKQKSIKGGWRIKESTLLILSVLFGAAGGLLAMYQLRHKTNHWYFVFINWVFLIIQIAILIYLLII